MIGLIMLGSINNYLTRSTLAVAAPTLLHDLHITEKQYSWIVGTFQGAIMAQPVCGYVLDVLGLRIGFAIFALAWSLVNMAHALAGNWHETHDFTFHYGFLRLIPDLALVKLDAKEDTYLLIEFRKPGTFRGAAWVQIAFLFFIIAVSVLIAVAMTYVYLRRKSKEARLVLSRLEKGDLKARFEIKRVDEIGSLMVDFNRMASEIERLVHRVQETEMARKNLLEELSHDLRTPLTSLNTSVETLTDHWNEMPREEQREFVSVIQTELGYFLHLIEDLFFIAAIGEPRYKKTTRKVDIFDLLAGEIKGRDKTTGGKPNNRISWTLDCDDRLRAEAFILGDPLLVQRLFKNAFDNATKYAASSVSVRILPSKDSVSVLVEDDGSGISDDEISSFGQRRRNRLLTDGSDRAISLGLGSVIMKTILELHGGTLAIRRVKVAGSSKSGTQLSLFLPKDPSEFSDDSMSR